MLWLLILPVWVARYAVGVILTVAHWALLSPVGAMVAIATMAAWYFGLLSEY